VVLSVRDFFCLRGEFDAELLLPVAGSGKMSNMGRDPSLCLCDDPLERVYVLPVHLVSGDSAGVGGEGAVLLLAVALRRVVS